MVTKSIQRCCDDQTIADNFLTIAQKKAEDRRLSFPISLDKYYSGSYYSRVLKKMPNKPINTVA
jgi:hypothetical protein